ncbi:SET domain-containing protein [Turneriella parva]|uniref:Nuclear protein SET n=1 Tax=Turneriella parva (strain ATCC BAA-1111 / DSM 21527 / NCTC 11395 / H) TaxID=869212 RepID=I4BAN7_TURPD|nr:SET domain-containing protein [Turneriella parva]AFM14344.1 nuclear protein SET [Turneriella parva DSM 21527]
MLNPKIEVRGSDIEGRGLFAREPIAAGEFIWQKDDGERAYSQAEIDAMAPEQRKNFYNYSYQTGPDEFYGTPEGKAGDDADYMNHSCDPNTWFEPDNSMTARRDIAKGEEITYDYATSEARADFTLQCRCGSPVCRHTVRGDDMRRIAELQQRYAGHAMAHTIAIT